MSGAASIAVLGLALTAAPPAQADGSSQYFPQTGHTVQAEFLTYFNAHGGLAQQGYPISDLTQEQLADGQMHTVQYFERSVFETHLENKPPYDTLLRLVAVDYYNARYSGGAANQEENNTQGSVYFEQTKHRLGGIFLKYWTEHGGLIQQGYPISGEFTETSALNGKQYQVQYFQRAEFEYHPENAGTPYEVLLAQLGKFNLAQKNGAPTSTGVAIAPSPHPSETQPPVAATATEIVPANPAEARIQELLPMFDGLQTNLTLNGIPIGLEKEHGKRNLFVGLSEALAGAVGDGRTAAQIRELVADRNATVDVHTIELLTPTARRPSLVRISENVVHIKPALGVAFIVGPTTGYTPIYLSDARSVMTVDENGRFTIIYDGRSPAVDEYGKNSAAYAINVFLEALAEQHNFTADDTHVARPNSYLDHVIYNVSHKTTIVNTDNFWKGDSAGYTYSVLSPQQ
ncbi:MAG: hypothetical protein M3Z04_12840 [Chloroflexota bacterium]|nr:hypothetical protein [Chloroflexota bacterium]